MGRGEVTSLIRDGGERGKGDMVKGSQGSVDDAGQGIGLSVAPDGALDMSGLDFAAVENYLAFRVDKRLDQNMR